MSLQSLPAAILAGIVVFIGFSNLQVFFRRPRYGKHLTFFFTCLVIGLYDTACALLYSATTLSDGARWQGLQLVSTALLCAIMPWFMTDFFSDVITESPAVQAVMAGLTTFFILVAVLAAVNPGGIFLPGAVPRVKTVPLPLGFTAVYREVELGFAAGAVNACALLLILLLGILAVHAYLRDRTKEKRSLVLVSILILACTLCDFAVALGILPFVYTAEYAIAVLALLIARSLSRKAAAAEHVQEELAASEARYQGVFRHSAVSLWIEDIGELRALLGGLEARGVRDLAAFMKDHPDFVRQAVHSIRVVDVNDATMRLYGAQSKEELLGPVDRTLDPDALPDFRNSIEAIAKGGESYETESTALTLRGRRLNVILSVHIPRRTAGDNRMLISVTDITARKRAEQMLQAFIEQSTEAILLADGTGCLVEFNPSAEKLLGLPRTEAVGHPLWNLMERAVPEEGRPPCYGQMMEERIREALRTGTADFLNRPITGTLRRPDGSRRHYVQFLFPIRTETGYMLGIISHDTTEERRNEEALRQSEERLRQAQKMEAVGTLAGGIAHDFNNLLTGILGHSSLLLEELPAGSPLASDVEAIESSARRAAELTRQILTFSRQDLRVEMGSLDPHTVIGEVVRLLSRTVDKSIAIETDLSAAAPRIRGNEGQIHQAVLNLCLNACDAMPRGGKLFIRTASEPDRRVSITVADTGIGMSIEFQERIFEPFFTTKVKGRGLGLPMVYGIVHGHGGEITVESEPGKGTTFRIVLPTTEEPPAEPVRDARSARGEAGTVLVIDDEPQVRRVAARILERAGYTVLQAEDGAGGLALFGQRRGAVDLVILDISMPGMGGAEVHGRLLAMDPGVKVLLSSGYSDDARVSEILAQGARSFLRKPYTVDCVLGAVREALGR